MINTTVYQIENKDYLLVDKIQDYFYFSNTEDDTDMMIRKIKNEDDSLFLPLDDESEYQKALSLFISKKIQ